MYLQESKGLVLLPVLKENPQTRTSREKVKPHLTKTSSRKRLKNIRNGNRDRQFRSVFPADSELAYTSIPIVRADTERDSLKDLATAADRYVDPPGVDANASAPETNENVSFADNVKDVSGSDEMGLSPPTSPGKTDRSQSREWGEFECLAALDGHDVIA